MLRAALTVLVLACFPAVGRSADWPMYRADAARSGYTPERLPDELSAVWVCHSTYRPESAWPTRNRLRFDRAYQPIVANGVVYFGAGIWPTEGVYLYAIDADSGKVIWRNDSSGSMEMDQPHPTARARSGVSAQGHFALSGDRLFVPVGRGVPAAFQRDTGKLLYWMLIFRSATLAYIDLPGPTVTRNYGGIRPGCWIPGIPAGGLLLMPDAASWCTCSYLNQGTVALRGRPAAAGR